MQRQPRVLETQVGVFAPMRDRMRDEHQMYNRLGQGGELVWHTLATMSRELALRSDRRDCLPESSDLQSARTLARCRAART